MRASTIKAFCGCLSLAALFFAGVPVMAEEEFHCEILSVEGKVLVTDPDGAERDVHEGDLLSAGDVLEAKEASSADIAFDRDWKNITHVEERSKMKIGTISPAQVILKEGGVFAKLKQLPKDSSFEVKTPTAVATVRGTEYRTTFIEGQTQIYNVSPNSSKVFVYPVKDDGSANRDRPVILEQSSKTQVAKIGELPKEPQAMTPDEKIFTETVTKKIEVKIQTAVTSGRVSKIQSVAELQKGPATETNKAPSAETELSRVVDARRRPFKKTGE